MRTRITAAALSLCLAGCVVGDAGPGPGGDEPGGDPGSGPGSGSGTGSGSSALNPRIRVVADRTAVTTGLGKEEVVTLSVTSVDGFAGDVAVAVSLVDRAGAALGDGITVAGPAGVTLAANATATAAYTVKIPTNATGSDLTAALAFDATSPVGGAQLTTSLAVAAVWSVTYAPGLAANVQAHPLRAMKASFKKGAKLEFHNADAVIHITHADGGFPHETQSATGGLQGKTYVIDTATLKAGDMGNIGCHTHNSATYGQFTLEP